MRVALCKLKYWPPKCDYRRSVGIFYKEPAAKKEVREKTIILCGLSQKANECPYKEIVELQTLQSGEEECLTL